LKYRSVLSLLLFFSLSATLFAASYDVKYHGTTLGRADTLETLKDHYLKAKVTNFLAKLLIGKKYFVFYSDQKPPIANAKFRKDNKMILYAFYESLTRKPQYRRYQINPIKALELRCSGDKCTFIYTKNGQINGKGYILFDQSGDFVKLREDISDFEIVKR